LVVQRGPLARLAVLLTIGYGTIALGGSSLHGLVGCTLHTAALGSDDHSKGKAGHPSLASACPLCHFLSQGQMSAERFIHAGTDLVRPREIEDAPVVSIPSDPLPTRPRAPPR
jgi:hypothetical protein